MKSNFPKAEEIFAAALVIDGLAERRSYVARACAGDDELRQEVESLLSAYHEQSSFLERPALGAAKSGQQDQERSTIVVTPRPLSERPGEPIGRYKLLEVIGEGGFGVVWMAEQQEPVRRRVAMKIIKLGMDTQQVVARFEAERQALALMDHPNIARVFDGGATEAGRPYFVMELVRGTSITEYCDAQKLTTAARLELFIQACQAVQHAHQKGVIHRDLKPSNILVSELDGKPVVKVIDFGVAKATQARLTEKTVFTRFHQLIGTPAYMSPEQAGLGGLDIDTRSDIYSLGVVLYELLTGRTPFDARKLLEQGYDAILRTIREEEPKKPSTRLSTLTAEELASAAARRRAEPARLNRLLRGDLDWIVMKTLDKDRKRRYETANGLALDLERHLKTEPVIARPASALYRFRKMVRRNRLAFGAGTALALSLIAGLALSTWLFLGEKQARKRATTAEESRRGEEQKRLSKELELSQARFEAQQKELGFSKQLASSFTELELQRAEELFASENTGEAMAHLAFILRRDPSNHVAANRLFSAVTQRSWPLPLIAPIQLPVFDPPTVIGQFSPDGNTFYASAPGFETADMSQKFAAPVPTLFLQLWDANTGRSLCPPRNYKAAGWKLRFTPGGLRAVLWSESQIQLCDVQSGSFIGQPVPTENRKLVSLDLSPDGVQVLEAASDGNARLWDARSGKALAQFSVAGESLDGALFSPDGTKVVVVSDSQVIRVWDLPSGKLIGGPHRFHDLIKPHPLWTSNPLQLVCNSAPWPQPGQEVTLQIRDAITGSTVAALTNLNRVVGNQLVSSVKSESYEQFENPDALRILTVSDDQKKMRAWDLLSGRKLAEFSRTPPKTIYADLVHFAEFSPNGLQLLTSGGGGWSEQLVQVHDLVGGEAMSLPMKNRRGLWSARFSPDGRRLMAIAGADREAVIYLWDCSFSRTPSRLISGDWFSPDASRAVSPSSKQALRLWDAQTGRSVAFVPVTAPLAPYPVHFSPDSRKFLTVAGTNDTIEIWDARTGKRIGEPVHFTLATGVHNAATFSADSRRIVTRGQSSIQVWDASSGKPIGGLLPTGNFAHAFQFTSDGSRLMVASQVEVPSLGPGVHNILRVWDISSGKLVAEPFKHLGLFDLPQISTNGLVLTAKEGALWIWDAETSRLLPRIMDTGPIKLAEFTPDGRSVLIICQDNGVQLWDPRQARPIGPRLEHKELNFPSDGVGVWYEPQLAPGGMRIATTAQNRVHLWDIESGKELIKPLIHASVVSSVQFAPDGAALASICEDGSVRIWDVPSGEPRTPPLKHDGAPRVVFSPDGTRLASYDGVLRVWDAYSGHLVCEPLHSDALAVPSSFSPDGRRLMFEGNMDALANGGIEGCALDLPAAPLPVPDWFINLAETLAGERLSVTGVAQPVELTELLDLKRQSASWGETNVYVRWAKWFFEDRGTQKLTPWSDMTFSEYVDLHLQDQALGPILKAVEADPTNERALERLAQIWLETLPPPVSDDRLRLQELTAEKLLFGKGGDTLLLGEQLEEAERILFLSKSNSREVQAARAEALARRKHLQTAQKSSSN